MTLGLATALVFWARAEASRRQALGYFEIASRHLDDLVRSAILPRESWDTSVRDTLTRARTTYRELLRQRPNDRQVRLTLARIDHQLALREMRRYRPGPYLPQLEGASRLADGLLAEDPDDPEMQVWACEVRVDLGVALWERMDLDKAIRVYQETCRMLEPLQHAASEPRARVVFARARRHLGLALFESGDSTEGLRLLEESGTELKRWLERNPNDGAVLRSVFLLCYPAESSPRTRIQSARLVEGLTHLAGDPGTRVQLALSVATRMDLSSSPEEVQGLARQLVDHLEPVIDSLARAASMVDDSGLLWYTSMLEEYLASAYAQLGRLQDSEIWSELGFRHRLDWILQHEDTISHARWLIGASARRAHRMMRRTDEPVGLDEAVAYLRGLYVGIGVRNDHPDIWRANLAHALAMLAAFRRIEAGRMDQSAELIRQSSRILDQLSTQLSGEPMYQLAVSELWTQIAKNRWRGPDRQAIREALLHAADAARAAFRLEPNDPEQKHRALLDDRLARLSRFCSEDNRFLEAETALEQCAELWDGQRDGLRASARGFRALAEAIAERADPLAEPFRLCIERCIERADALEKRAAN